MIPHAIADAAVIDAFPEFDLRPEPLGVGGMKNAYLGERNADRVVVKVIREPVQSEEFEGMVSLPERLRREIEGMKTINHPGIVKVVEGPDIRSIEGASRVWYVEPYYSGGTLEDRAGEPFPANQVLDITTQLLEAVGALAAHNIVHRDIKPGNIVFDQVGRCILLDLGIALFVDLTPLTNQFGLSPRTPKYAAPEQFDVRARVRVDARTDLFLVGMVAFEMLTGRHPFDPSQPDTYLDRLVNGHFDVDALDAVDASEGIRYLLKRLLAPNRSHRFRTVDRALAAAEACR